MAPSPNEGGRARAEAQRVGQRRERCTGGAGERPCPGQATGRLGGLHQTQGMVSKVLTLPTSSPVAFTLGAVGWRAASSKSSPVTCPWNLRTSLRCNPFLPTSPPLLQHLPGLRSLAVSKPNCLPLGPPPGFRCPLPYCPSQLRNSEAVGVRRREVQDQCAGTVGFCSKHNRDTPAPPARSPFHVLSSRLLTTLGTCRAIPGSLNVFE
ncbi:uncharacterized protein LOC106978651 isoform X2 [Acinonyx jubatus]|uniref:Uncharacterized protein LOC106978651 isoform X2 n=1 Tax=Acinonyx jubatus TaxID=32536 RepID=A0A6J1YYK2_ACIJB|nr:uncharacterized protein LOC106978651 isoform X2 [Acinonyx jubatus]